jgi:hypothetical protein
MNAADLLQQNLARLGPHCPLRLLWMLDGTVNYLHAGWWIRERGFQAERFLATRQDIFSAAAEKLRNRKTLYLEFGVFQGETLKLWSGLLQNPESMLHGFDSFEGLPNQWHPMHGRGTFSTGGTPPQIGDSRIKLFKGWFDETLPHYTPPPHEEMFVNIDCDLYSSTKTVLGFLRPHISPGTYLYFDEFHHRDHELKAFEELLDENSLKFRLVAANRQFSHVLFQCVPNR